MSKKRKMPPGKKEAVVLTERQEQELLKQFRETISYDEEYDEMPELPYEVGEDYDESI